MSFYDTHDMWEHGLKVEVNGEIYDRGQEAFRLAMNTLRGEGEVEINGEFYRREEEVKDLTT